MWEIPLRILAKSAVTLAGRHHRVGACRAGACRAGACRAGNDLEKYERMKTWRCDKYTFAWIMHNWYVSFLEELFYIH